MFIDNVALTLSSGKGGPGCVSFRREKHVIQGGPDGGDGGKGGNVYFQVDANTHTLSHFRNNQHLKARNGEQGMGRKMYGKSGEHLVVIVPPGTQVIDAESGEILMDLLEEGEKKLFLEIDKNISLERELLYSVIYKNLFVLAIPGFILMLVYSLFVSKSLLKMFLIVNLRNFSPNKTLYNPKHNPTNTYLLEFGICKHFLAWLNISTIDSELI